MNRHLVCLAIILSIWSLSATALRADVDLRINSAHIDDTNLIASQTARVSFSLSNLGGDGVESVRVYFLFLTEKGNLGSAVGGLHSTDVSSYSALRSGETATYYFHTTFSNLAGTGDYWLHLEIIPPSGAGIDPDTSNNSMFTDNSAHYTAPRTDGADVVILSCGFWSDLSERNFPITGRVEYLNNSTVAAQNITIRFYLSTDAVISDGDMLLATFNKGTLDHQFYQKQSLEVPLDPSLPDGIYYGGVIISSSNDIDLSNNTARSGEIQIGNVNKPTKGSLQVVFWPDDARYLAAWRLVGTEQWYGHLQSVTGLKPGEYELEFREVEGFQTPANRTAIINAGHPTTLNVTYLVEQKRPKIKEFRIVPSEVYYSEPAWLIWKVDNAYSVSIKPKGGWHGGAIGSDLVRMKESATFTLTALYWVPDKWGSDIRYTASSKARLKVKRNPEIKLFTSNSSEDAPLHTSEAVKLYWSTGGATKLLFDTNDDGYAELTSRLADGEKELHMDASGSVRLTVSGKKNDVWKTIPIYMTELPVIRSFTVSPRTPVAGEEVTLSWNAPGLENGIIEPLGVGITETQGEYRFTPGESMDLTLRVNNEHGQAEATQRFDVDETGTDLSLELKSTLAEGGKRNPIRIEGGSTYTANVTLSNNGNRKARNFLIAMYADGELVDQERINVALPKGSFEGITLSYTPVKPGKVALEIVVDPEGAVPEKDRGNNSDKLYLFAEVPKQARAAIGNIRAVPVGRIGKKSAFRLDFDVAQFGGIGKTAYFYEVLVSDVDNHGREKEVARLEGFLDSNLSNRRLEHVTRLFKLDKGELNSRIEIHVMNVKNTNGFIDLSATKNVDIRSLMESYDR